MWRAMREVKKRCACEKKRLINKMKEHTGTHRSIEWGGVWVDERRLRGKK